jgi:hypothetical protein
MLIKMIFMLENLVPRYVYSKIDNFLHVCKKTDIIELAGLRRVNVMSNRK